jgi:hypothetical protein
MTSHDDDEDQDFGGGSWRNSAITLVLYWVFVLVGMAGVLLFGWWWGPYFYSIVWITSLPGLTLVAKIKAATSANLRLRREPVLQVFLAQNMERNSNPEVRQTYRIIADQLRDHAEAMEPGVQRRVWMLQEHERQWGWLKNVDPGAL